MINIRAGILAVTICAIIFTVDNQPRPVKRVEVPYCLITYKAIGKDVFGKTRLGWATGYGPCSLQDIYRYI